MKKTLLLCILVLLLSYLSAVGVAVIDVNQGQFVRLSETTYNVSIENQVALVTCKETFVNDSDTNVSPKLVFPIPEGASATFLRWQINDVWHTAVISGNQQDSSIVGPPSNLPQYFSDYIKPFPIMYNFNEAMSDSDTLIVELTYVQLLNYSFGNVELNLRNNYLPIQLVPLNHQQINIDISSDRTIESVVADNHPASEITNSGDLAMISWAENNTTADMNFDCHYSLNQDQLGLWSMSTILETVPDELGSGFFTFIAEPDPSNNTEVINKVFTLIIDRSGSMYGTKIQQAKDAANYIVNHLNEGDKFNIISYSGNVTTLWPEHMLFSTTTKNQAMTYINNISADGSTNISGAFDMAVPQFTSANDSTANIIIFLTDGLPTSGITEQSQLIQHIDNLITQSERSLFLFNFGIGNDVDRVLLSTLANNNQGLAFFLGNDQVENVITNFYNLIQNPVLLNPVFVVEPTNAITEVYPDPLPNLYKGSQMIVSGRYQTSQNVTIHLNGTAFGQPVNYTYQMNLADTVSSRYQFLSKIWAKQKIEYLLRQYYTYPEGSEMALQIKAHIIEISVDYGVMCVFTSFSEGVGNEEEISQDSPTPAPLKLLGNYPNPFNPTTSIRFEVKDNISGPAFIKIYNIKGQLIRVLGIRVNGKGNYEIVWDGCDQAGKKMATGVYFYTLSLKNNILSGKMLMLK